MKDAKISVRLSEQEKKQLERIALNKDVSVAQIVREAIRKYMEAADVRVCN